MRLSLIFAATSAISLSAFAQETRPTVIHGKIISTHDRLPPIEVRDIVVETDFTFTLSGKNNIKESWSSVPLRNQNSPALHYPPMLANNEAALGEAGSTISWRVLGPHKLQRIAAGKQFILIVEITTDDNRNCTLEANFLLQKGKTSIINRRSDNGELAYYSLNKVNEASCSIE